jgi:hypothetical protein
MDEDDVNAQFRSFGSRERAARRNFVGMRFRVGLVYFLLSSACSRDDTRRVVKAPTDTPAAQLAGNGTVIRVDSVFVRRDLDGDGRPDYVVRERRGSDGSTLKQAYRMAVYLDARPETRAPAWTTDWEDEDGDALGLEQDYRLSVDATLLFVMWNEANHTPEWLVTVRRGRVRDVISHDEDHGEGYLQVKPDGEHVVVDATQMHLLLNGTPVGRELVCKEGEWPAVRLAYDAASSQFVPEEPRCIARSWLRDTTSHGAGRPVTR